MAHWDGIIPAGDTAYKNWYPSSGTNHEALIDEGMASKNITDYISAGDPALRDQFTWSVPAENFTGIVTSMTLYLYCVAGPFTKTPGLTVKLFQGATERYSGSWSMNTLGVWKVCTFVITGLSIDPADGDIEIAFITFYDAVPPAYPEPTYS